MYSRQKIIPQIGSRGQEILEKAVVTVVGAGGLGCPAAQYLAYAGVGTIRLIDGDEVALSNLNRQILYQAEDLGKPKAKTAAKILGEKRPQQKIVGIQEIITPQNASELLAGSHVVVDCVDSQTARICVGGACAELGIPLVEGGIHGFYGYVISVGEDTPCLGCLGYLKEETSEIPSLGAAAGVIGSLQACECVKILTGAGSPLYGRLLTYDGLDGSFDCINVQKSPDCPVHGKRKNEFHDSV